MADVTDGTTPAPDLDTAVTLKSSVGWLGIVFFVIAAAAPLTVVFGSVPPAITFGGVGISGAMLVAGAVLILFAVGFTAMSNYVTNAGAFYAYASHGIGKPVGIGVALLALVSYAVLSISFYGLIGFFANITVTQLFGADVPWWVFSMAALGVVMLLSRRQADVGVKVLGVLLTLEIGIVAILCAAILIKGGAEPFSMEPFTPHAVFGVQGAGILFVFAFGAYLGFEATAVYAEEARDAVRAVPKATYVAVTFLALFYAASAATIIYGLGVEGTLAIAHDPASAQFLTSIAADQFLGTWGVNTMLVLVVTSFLACLISFHNATARYLFSMGREGLLPRWLGAVNNHGAPWLASLVLLAVAAVVVAVVAVTGRDPYFGMAVWSYAAGVVGLVMVQALAAFSVIGYFLRDRRGHGVARVLIAPLLGAIGLVIAWVLIATNLEALTGSAGARNVLLILPTPILLLVGIVWGLVMRSRQPTRYAQMLSAQPAQRSSL